MASTDHTPLSRLSSTLSCKLSAFDPTYSIASVYYCPAEWNDETNTCEPEVIFVSVKASSSEAHADVTLREDGTIVVDFANGQHFESKDLDEVTEIFSRYQHAGNVSPYAHIPRINLADPNWSGGICGRIMYEWGTMFVETCPAPAV